MGEGRVAEKLRSIGVSVRALGLSRGRLSLAAILQLACAIRDWNPDIVHTWMYHANIVGALANALLCRAPLVSGIHHANLDPAYNKLSTRLAAITGAVISRCLPDCVICVSRSALEMHKAIGYDPAIMEYIPNGVDTGVFNPNAASRAAIRQSLGVGEAPLCGIVARFDPLKDLPTFVKAARIVAQQVPGAHFVVCGAGLDARNEILCTLVQQAGLTGKFHLLGPREDVPAILTALDLFCLTSCGEAFPNVIVEAMASGVPPVVTNVGDCSEIVGDCGLVSPAGDWNRIASHMQAILGASPECRIAMGARARARVEHLFELRVMAKRYQDVYKRVLRSARGTRFLSPQTLFTKER
jgi:glycosyltransferase involved in cell wall biosynthesis